MGPSEASASAQASSRSGTWRPRLARARHPMAIARLSSRAFLGLVSSRRGRPILLRPRAHLWGVALSLQFFPALRRRLLLLACLSAAAVLAGLPDATAEKIGSAQV